MAVCLFEEVIQLDEFANCDKLRNDTALAAISLDIYTNSMLFFFLFFFFPSYLDVRVNSKKLSIKIIKLKFRIFCLVTERD